MKYVNINLMYMLISFTTINAMQKDNPPSDNNKSFILQVCDKYKLPDEIKKAYHDPLNKPSLRNLCKYLQNAEDNFNQCDTKEFKNFSLEDSTLKQKQKYGLFFARKLLAANNVIDNTTQYINDIATREDWTLETTGNVIAAYWIILASLKKKQKH